MAKSSFKKRRGAGSFFSALIGAIIGGLIVFVMTNLVVKEKEVINESSIENNGKEIVNIKANGDDLSMESAVVKKSIDSVVGITTKTQTTQSTRFGLQRGYVEGVGSGSIFTEDGYILTNSHVISDGDAEEINVLFNDGQSMPAELIWNDTTLDLAVIKVDGKNLPAIEFGDSDKMIVGARVVAIGNPLGLQLQSTVTSGIISGLNRTVTFQTGASMDGLMQTDAAINSGNSGGALLNTKGELIGINTAKAGNSDGIGFAIPSNLAKKIADQIIKNGDFKSVYLGISGFDLKLLVQASNVDTKRLGTDTGIVVKNVYDENLDSIQEGDIITAIDDKKIEDMSQLKKILLDYTVGDKAEITLYRDGEEKKVEFEFSLDSSNVDIFKQALPNTQRKDEEGENEVRKGFFPFWLEP